MHCQKVFQLQRIINMDIITEVNHQWINKKWSTILVFFYVGKLHFHLFQYFCFSFFDIHPTSKEKKNGQLLSTCNLLGDFNVTN